MNKDKQFVRYLQFPLTFFKGIWNEESVRERVFSDIIKFGIVEYAYKLQRKDPTETAKRIIRDYVRERLEYHQEIFNELTNLEENNPDVLNFEEMHEDEFDGVAIEFAQSLSESQLTFYGIPAAKKYLFIDEGDRRNEFNTWFKNRKEGVPMPMISKDLAFEFKDCSKSEFDLAQLAGYIACKSILGQGFYKKTNKDLVVARMLGYSTPKNIQLTSLSKAQRKVWDKYHKRWHFDKLTDYLEAFWGIHRYGKVGMRGFYIADAAKINFETLAKKVNEPDKRKERQNEKKKIAAKYEV